MGKNLPGQNLPDKRPPDKIHGQKPLRTIERDFVHGAFVRVFSTRPNKNREGSEMCDVLLGSPGKCDKGEADQIWPKIAWHSLWMAPIV